MSVISENMTLILQGMPLILFLVLIVFLGKADSQSYKPEMHFSVVFCKHKICRRPRFTIFRESGIKICESGVFKLCKIIGSIYKSTFTHVMDFNKPSGMRSFFHDICTICNTFKMMGQVYGD